MSGILKFCMNYIYIKHQFQPLNVIFSYHFDYFLTEIRSSEAWLGIRDLKNQDLKSFSSCTIPASCQKLCIFLHLTCSSPEHINFQTATFFWDFSMTSNGLSLSHHWPSMGPLGLSWPPVNCTGVSVWANNSIIFWLDTWVKILYHASRNLGIHVID